MFVVRFRQFRERLRALAYWSDCRLLGRRI
jgi:hypothetical protein